MKKQLLCVALAALLAPATALAAESDTATEREGPTFGVGARVGGYGFREVKGDNLAWNDCRMNGTGMFGTIDIGRYFFGELSADLYHATAAQVNGGMDRVSFHTMGALGAKMLPDSWVTPYVQVGGGPEFTRLDVDGTVDKRVLPAAFMGVGGELNAGHFHFGSNIRVFSMGLPAHGHGEVTQALQPEGSDDHGGSDGIEVRHEVAGQMLFFARYHF
jgi:hypothetical protein